MNRIITSLIAAAMCSLSLAQPSPVGPTPTPDQNRLQDMEMYAFLHYSLNTYTDQEWGFGNEDPALFNPQHLDARQWARTCKNAGMKGIIFTAKHHCGFCMWPSAYTEYSIRNSPWRGGQGDVVKELAQACRAEGLRFAVYLSPWDRNHPEYGRPGYVTYFRNQLRELLTQYGDIFEVWFDGANGGNGWYGGANETRQIDRLTYYQWDGTYQMIRQLQPHCIIWNDGANRRGDLRWCGTEAGYIGDPNWSLMNSTGEVLREHRQHGVPDGDVWVPGEVDTSIRPGWFYHQQQDGQVKSLARLMDIYYKSVGRNATLLLNFPITPDGLIHPIDSARGASFAHMVQQVFRHDLARGAHITASSVRGRKYDARRAADGKPNTYWAPGEGKTTGTLTIDFGRPTTFNRFMAQEYITLGQRVSKFQLEALVDGQWQPLRDALTDTDDGLNTIGRKRIICFPTVTATQLRFTITDSKAEPLITHIGVYNAPDLDADKAQTQRHASQYNVFRAQGNRSIMLDLGGTRRVQGLRYLPPQQHGARGIITHYSLWAQQGTGWKRLAQGEFSNIVNNPIWQDIRFDATDTSLLKLDADRISGGNQADYQDLEVIMP